MLNFFPYVCGPCVYSLEKCLLRFLSIIYQYLKDKKNIELGQLGLCVCEYRKEVELRLASLSIFNPILGVFVCLFLTLYMALHSTTQTGFSHTVPLKERNLCVTASVGIIQAKILHSVHLFLSGGWYFPIIC